MSVGKIVFRIKIQLNLVICSIHCAEWNTVPTAAYRTVDMPEKNVPDIVIIAQNLVNPLRVFSQVNTI